MTNTARYLLAISHYGVDIKRGVQRHYTISQTPRVLSHNTHRYVVTFSALRAV
jgi:hypothetical protein